VWPNRQFDPHIIVGHLDASFATSVTDGTVAAPGQLLLTLGATALRAQLTHARKELLAAQERTRIAIAGGDAEDLARLEADLRRTDAELAKLGRDRDSLRLSEGDLVALPGGVEPRDGMTVRSTAR